MLVGWAKPSNFINPCYCLIAQHGSQFNLDVRLVKMGPLEMDFPPKPKNHLIGEKPAGARRLGPYGEIEGSLPAQLSR